MPKLTKCLISVDLALSLRELVRAMKLKRPNGNLQFKCPECGVPVKPHAQGEGTDGIDGPHFEHLKGHRKKPCSYRHGAKATT